jgi:hypothetical protein
MPRLPFRKSYEVVGYSYEGSLYCRLHVPKGSEPQGDEPYPVFLGDVQEGDVCDHCLEPLEEV